MKVPLLHLIPQSNSGIARGYLAAVMLALAGTFFLLPESLLAEGSRDLIKYPGYRMFLDTRDSQQLKVFVRAGETINLGSSHVGIKEGFIRVYRPDGTLDTVFDNTGLSTNKAIIFNSKQEREGPTGGGTLMGAGYVPGIIPVGTGQEGIWTIVFDYPTYQNTSFLNILNSDTTWTRAVNQPQSRRIVLAWDVTVSSGGAINMGGTEIKGRLYTNEHISLINGNGVTTSPTLYVLTDDGYQYKVDIKMADPFRFPISSNSLGLVRGNLNPIYKSKQENKFRRSASPGTWNTSHPDSLYLYEPQARDFEGLINNKIFFNLPDPSMPANAKVTDIFRDDSHQTWLFKQPDSLVLTNFYLIGANPGGTPCSQNVMAFQKGAWLVFVTNIGGSVTLQLDLNNDGDYLDSIDVEIEGQIVGGIDSIYWDGKDGFGNPIMIQDSFQFNYQGMIRYGEIHISLTDVEANKEGVTFTRIQPQSNTITDSLFYFDHSDFGGPNSVSGGGTPGNALPTTAPFTYENNFGNDRYLDQWAFLNSIIGSTPLVINIIDNCTCTGASPDLEAVIGGGGDFCVGENLALGATNTVTGIGNIAYTWSGPGVIPFTETIAEGDTTSIAVANLTNANTGNFKVVGLASNGCKDSLTFQVNVNPLPVLSVITGGGTVCSGANVTLTAANTVVGIASVNYTWTGPNGFLQTGTVSGLSTITATITGITEAGEGTYTLTVESNVGCVSLPVSANVIVNSTPVLTTVSGGGPVCEAANMMLVAVNSAPGIPSMTCQWTGPNGFFIPPAVITGDTVKTSLTNLTINAEGIYTLICTNVSCSDTLTFNVDVNRTPQISGISPNGSFCAGTDTVLLTAMNVIAGTGPITYTWTGPNNFMFTGTGPELGPFPAPIINIQPVNAGVYTLVLTTAGGCQSTPQTVTIGVLPSPVICNVTGAGDKCVGQDVVLSASNCTAGVGPIIYTWTHSVNGVVGAGLAGNNGPFTATLDNVQLSDSGTYTLVLQSVNNDCLSEPVDVELNVLPGLNIVDVTPDSIYCEGTSVVLTATNTVAAGDITYTWTGPNGFTFTDTVGSTDPLSVTIPNITVSQAGNYILTLTSAAGCTAEPDTVSVEVIPGVTITSVSGGGEYCEGATVTLGAEISTSSDTIIYTWTGPCGFSYTDTLIGSTGPLTAVIDSIIAACAGTYTLTVSTIEGCTAGPVSVEIGVILYPNIIFMNTDTVLCELDTLTLFGQNGVPGISFDYTWVTPSGTTIPGVGTGTIPFFDTITPLVTFGAGTYTLVLSNQGCPVSDTFYLDLKPNPVISPIPGGGTYCEGDTVIISFWNTNPAVDSLYYTCLLPNGTLVTSIGGGQDTLTFVVTEAGTYCCSLESFDGCGSSLECVTVNFEPTGDPTVVDTIELCAGDTLFLDGQNLVQGTGTITYTWTGPGGFTFTGTAPWNGPFPATDLTPEEGNYCLTLTSGIDCVSDSACTYVVIHPVPELTSGINGGGSACVGETVTLDATIFISDGSEIDYEWTLNGVSIETGTAPSGTTLTLDVTGSGQYCLKLTSNEGCESEFCTSVTFNPTPEILTVTGGGEYCEGENVMLNGTGVAGLGMVMYTWTGPNNFSFSGTAPSAGPFPASILGIMLNQSGFYVLTLKLDDCTSESDSVEVIVNPKPMITETIGGGPACVGSPMTIGFTLDPKGATSVDFTITGPGIDTSGTVTQTTTITFDITVNSSTVGTYTMTAVSDKDCPADPAVIIVSQLEVEPATLTASSTTLCQGDPLQLTTNPQVGNNVTYEWYKDGQLITTTTVPVLDIPNPMAGNYTVVALVDGCSSTSNVVAITVTSPPAANDDNYITDPATPVSENILTNDNPSTGVSVIVVSQPSNGSVTVDANGNMVYTPNAGFSGTDQFTYRICLTICDDLCDEAIVRIEVEDPPCLIPNIITPNGDDVNDVLNIGCERLNGSLKIFNRWGDEIYTAEPYLNDWDGTYGNDKKELPAGTYFYIFREDKNASAKQTGYIKVVR